jgi:CRISPR-associated protein Cmr4
MPKLLFIHTLSPLHAGTGHAVGAVDLPIAREKSTGFPYLPGSSIKGVLRSAATESAAVPVREIFGPDRNTAHEHAGALLIGDAGLLLMPVRSLVGTFAWVTSPWLLRRFARDAREAGVTLPATLPEPSSAEQALVTDTSGLVSGERVVFEDLDFIRQRDPSVEAVARALGALLFPDSPALPDAAQWRALVAKRICILHDDAMVHFSEQSTEVFTRIALDPELKTVAKGALWTEEALPSETILVSLVGAQRVRGMAPREVLASVAPVVEHPLQFGGEATVGRGRCRLIFAGGEQ